MRGKRELFFKREFIKYEIKENYRMFRDYGHHQFIRKVTITLGLWLEIGTL